jgi:hypothetical protein
MPRTNVVGTTAPPGSGAQRCAQAGEREHITDSMTGSAATMAAWSSPLLSAYDGQRRDNPAAMAPYVAIVPDTAFPGMYRLKRSDGSLSDLVNWTRARDALAEIRGRP